MKRNTILPFFSGILLPLFLTAAFLAATIVGCAGDATSPGNKEEEEVEESSRKDLKCEKEKNPAEKNNLTENGVGEEIEPLDYEKHQPNELGDIMILMYHVIGDEEGTWERTRENFRQDLSRLYEKGYRPVNLMDAVQGEMNLPPGKSPVVLTFDDGTEGHFGYVEKDGEKIIDPDSAVGILLDKEEKYEDFEAAGTFFVNYLPVPFRNEEYYEEKIAHLHELGFEIGNHGYNHKNLAHKSPEEIQEELGRHQKYTESIIPDYHVESLALAFGVWPQNEDYREYVFTGEYQGVEYQHKAVLNVGANPANSPFHKDFNPLDLPRIRADQERMDQWLEYYENNPHKRYVSDGRQNVITFPKNKEDKLATDWKESDKEIDAYKLD